MEIAKAVNLLVRFLLELAALGALGYWGYHAGSNQVTKLGLAVALPVLAAAIWGLFVAPKATFPVPTPLHIALQVAIFGGAALALYAARRPELAQVFAVVVVVNVALMTAWQQ